MYIAQQQLEKWLQEDVPYFDLTTHLLNMGDRNMQVDFYAREEAILSGSEEVKRIGDLIGVTTTHLLPSGTAISPGEPFHSASGTFDSLNRLGKVAQNIFEYASAIATRTARMTKEAKAVNSTLQILTTRKVFPGTKELAIKSVLAGGAYPHRLGLSESILLFKQHIDAIGGFNQLPKKIEEIKRQDVEKMIIVEVDTVEEAMQVCEYAVDGIQYDKFASKVLTETVTEIKAKYPNLVHLATGGIHENNVKEYAQTGVDGLVTTSVYFGKPVDVGLKWR